MAKRAEKLVYLGGAKDGHPAGSYFDGVPPRDLDADDVARLSDERYQEITTAHPTLGPLYAPSKTDARKAEPPPAPAVVPEGVATASAGAEPVEGGVPEGDLR